MTWYSNWWLRKEKYILKTKMFYFKKEENYFWRMLTGEVYYALYCNVSISIDPEQPVAEALVAGDIPGST